VFLHTHIVNQTAFIVS